MASKKQGTSASDDSPIDFVSAAGTVQLVQGFINELMFTRIEFGGQLRSCPGWRRQLIKPTELGNAFIKLSRWQKIVSVCLGITLQICLGSTSFFKDKVPIDGYQFVVQSKISKWRGPGYKHRIV